MAFKGHSIKVQDAL
ncbi:hypothetical protein C359_01415 [Cryptococcus neoformans Bt120]|nr:hypothetical protein C359_01415 [Cryptococcus neoformans var. grubii Bt120]